MTVFTLVNSFLSMVHLLAHGASQSNSAACLELGKKLGYPIDRSSSPATMLAYGLKHMHELTAGLPEKLEGLPTRNLL